MENVPKNVGQGDRCLGIVDAADGTIRELMMPNEKKLICIFADTIINWAR
jgi:hypothetical protein